MTAPEPVNLELPAIASSVRVARQAIATLAATCGLDDQAVALCVSEAVTNAIVHGYPADRPGSVRVRARSEVGDSAGLRVEIEDDGDGMRPRPDSPGLGLGLPLIASMASSVDIDSSGTGCRVSIWFAG
ncbi:ATP-binding protein [Capillimicrobium parvum]|uniref:Anti-sigma F factor n=1 Tax=Capillimicrobium parvum TaxID=2884022 RepID=A0A9E6XYG3_9ACTN|nr:ATP-binding protein [Capillimicrobium parvum]UGS36232.1 Anti-sigma F factor [Capillimicrobium parvum]